jgi:predicted outer membrane protein
MGMITRWLVRLAALALLSIAAGAQAPERSILATLNRLAIKLPSSAFANPSVKAPLEALAREPCDQKAIEAAKDVPIVAQPEDKGTLGTVSMGCSA